MAQWFIVIYFCQKFFCICDFHSGSSKSAEICRKFQRGTSGGSTLSETPPCINTPSQERTGHGLLVPAAELPGQYHKVCQFECSNVTKKERLTLWLFMCVHGKHIPREVTLFFLFLKLHYLSVQLLLRPEGKADPCSEDVLFLVIFSRSCYLELVTVIVTRPVTWFYILSWGISALEEMIQQCKM